MRQFFCLGGGDEELDDRLELLELELEVDPLDEDDGVCVSL